MLSSDDGSSSLGSGMTSSNSPCTGPGDHHGFASQYSLLQGSFPLSAAGSGQQLATSTSSNFPALGYARAGQMPEWPYSRDEKWVFEHSEGTSSTRVTNLRSHMGVPQSLNPPGYGRGLQRFHSAPSSFLEGLADFSAEDVFTQVSSDPLGDRDDDLLTWADNLSPINDRGPQQMDTEKDDATRSSLNGCSEQFLVIQTESGRRRSTISPSTPFGKVHEPRSLTRPDGLGGYGAIPAIQDSMGESRTPSFQMASFLSPAESLSVTSEEKYSGGNSTLSSAYPPDYQISYQLGKEHGVSGSGLWNCPTSPGTLDGNSLPGMGGMINNEPPGGLGSTSSRLRVGGTLESASKLGLIRHSSLPASTSRPFSATMDLDDFISADSSTAPSRSARASRGHATHPRSIAERVRRGKISERMKKLQDVVPNMERQSNTSDMLDEVVEYVRQLQVQVQELSNTVVQLQEGLLHGD